MTFFVLGINHKTASLGLRERVTFISENDDRAIGSLLEHSLVKSAVILSTCNRTEIYLSTLNSHNLKEKLILWLCSYHHILPSDVEDSLYWYQDEQMVRHLMRVASGLDSMILGESQILGQVKKAFFQSKRAQILDINLQHLFSKIFAVAKKIRTETEIGSHAISFAYAACCLSRNLFSSLEAVTILLVGAGKMMELIVRHLSQHKVGHILIANRSLKQAEKLANFVSAEVISLQDLDTNLIKADIVISATASQQPLISKEVIKTAMKFRYNRPMLLIDMALPRDIEGKIATLDNIYLYDIDDLQKIIQQNLAKRQAAAIKAEDIIHQESHNFMDWLRTKGAVGEIGYYRDRAEKLRAIAEKKALIDIRNGKNIDLAIKKLTHQLTNRLIHIPTKALKQAASQGDAEKLRMLRDIFELNDY